MNVPAVERTLLILEALLKNPEGLAAQELQRQLNISRSTLYAILGTLKEMDYVVQPANRSPFQAGSRLVGWQRTTPLTPLDLMRAFHTEAAALELPETLALLLPAAEGLLVLAQVEPAVLVRCRFETGQVCEPNSNAAGDLFPPAVPPPVHQLGYQLHRTAESLSLALPICADGYHPEAALLLCAPAYRTNEEKLLDDLPALREAAARLSYRLGAQVYAPYHSPQASPLAPAQSLEAHEVRRFLDGPWAARLACVRPDGRPHVVPVWHEWDGENFYVIAWQGSHWGDYLRANPRLSLTVDEPWPPLRRVSVQGHAEALAESAAREILPGLQQRLLRRYLGHMQHPALDERQGSLFRIWPEKMTGWRGLPAAGS
jgi:DNA-binding IclR family transcriptional regulator/nitroimidazol reductase NimA-like FMN-containing flavoprotein (pyridoxamine 5'-phosphate oxidase superfamily)